MNLNLWYITRFIVYKISGGSSYSLLMEDGVSIYLGRGSNTFSISKTRHKITRYHWSDIWQLREPEIMLVTCWIRVRHLRRFGHVSCFPEFESWISLEMSRPINRQLIGMLWSSWLWLVIVTSLLRPMMVLSTQDPPKTTPKLSDLCRSSGTPVAVVGPLSHWWYLCCSSGTSVAVVAEGRLGGPPVKIVVRRLPRLDVRPRESPWAHQ